jgi:hypothetical protein
MSNFDKDFVKALAEHHNEYSREQRRREAIRETCLTCCYSMDEGRLCGYYSGNPKNIDNRMGVPCSKYVKDLGWKSPRQRRK